MLIPIKNQKRRVVGVIEIKNMKNQLFAFDEEYFGICLANFCNRNTINSIKQSIFIEEIKMKNYFFEAHLDFCHSKSYFDFTKKIQYWANIIFGYKNSKIVFCKDD